MSFLNSATLISRLRYLLSALLGIMLFVLYGSSPAAVSSLPVAVSGSPQELSSRVTSALEAFGQAKIQKISIMSQSAADPLYNTAEKLLAYPGGAWEFEFYLDKANQVFLYREALDADELSLVKKGKTLWSKPSGQGWKEVLISLKARQNQPIVKNNPKEQIPGKGWRKVKTSLLSRTPYTYSRATTLEQYPFLFLRPYPQFTEKVGMCTLQGQDYFIVKVKPYAPKNTLKSGEAVISPDTPRELLLWISATGTPRIAKAVYFWVSTPPGGVLYTANQVTFEHH